MDRHRAEEAGRCDGKRTINAGSWLDNRLEVGTACCARAFRCGRTESSPAEGSSYRGQGADHGLTRGSGVGCSMSLSVTLPVCGACAVRTRERPIGIGYALYYDYRRCAKKERVTGSAAATARRVPKRRFPVPRCLGCVRIRVQRRAEGLLPGAIDPGSVGQKIPG